MYRWNWNMDPRGRKNGHRGFRPAMIPGIIGLVFFGWIALVAAMGALSGVLVLVLSALHGLVHFLPRLFTGTVSGGGFALGFALGLLWYVRNHRKNMEAEKAEESRESGGAVDGASVETEVIEAPAYRTFGA